METLTVGSLFAGIGGFDLGFERCGMQTVWQVEQNPYCLAVLEKNFPEAQRFEDVRDVGSHNLAPVDLICGGFPCQDISLAGGGAGIDGARSGLWAEFARIIGELGPRYAVVENVPAITSRGADRVLRDLAAIGYDAEWDCLPASAVGAPHQRDRFWLVAYPNSDGVRLIAERDQREGWEVRAALGGVTVAAHDGSPRYLANAARDAQAGATSETRAKWERVGSRSERSGERSHTDADSGGCKIGSQLNGEQKQDPTTTAYRRHSDGLCDQVADASGQRYDRVADGAGGDNADRADAGRPEEAGGVADGCSGSGTRDLADPQCGGRDGLHERVEQGRMEADAGGSGASGTRGSTPPHITAEKHRGMTPEQVRESFPTPTSADGKGGPGTSPKRTGGENLRTAVGGQLNPTWVEWLMGFPLEWTALLPSATPSSPKSRSGSGSELSNMRKDKADA